METSEILKELSVPFPEELLRYNSAKNLTYVPIAEVIARLNRVIGVDNWSTEIVDTWREPDHPDWVLARVRLTITIGEKTITREGVGGQQVKHKKNGDVVDLGDEYKGAYSDALKKAAQSLGIALELARTDEALGYEEAITTPVEPTKSELLFDALKTHLNTMDDEQKGELKAWWSETFPGEKAPSNTTNSDFLDEAIAFAVAIKLDAVDVSDSEPEVEAAPVKKAAAKRTAKASE